MNCYRRNKERAMKEDIRTVGDTHWLQSSWTCRLQDLPYCRHMGLNWDFMCNVCRQAEPERRREAFVSATCICPRALWVITEEQGRTAPTLFLWKFVHSAIPLYKSPPPSPPPPHAALLLVLCVRINDCPLIPACMCSEAKRAKRGHRS